MSEVFWRRCVVGAVGTLLAVAAVAAGQSSDQPAGTGTAGAAARATSTPAPTPVTTALSPPGGSPAPQPARATTAPPASRATDTGGFQGTGVRHTVSGSSAVAGTGPLRRYAVQVEGGLGVDRRSFAAAVQRTLGDRRGWGRTLSFQRVATGPVAFTVVLAGPELTDRLCAPLRTNGRFSCFQAGRAVVNARRWFDGAASYRDRLALYRQYVVTHEVGHALGHGHEHACRPDGLAPVMMQQTKSLYGCRPNPWPYP